MEATEQPKKPWWRKKRWRAAGLCWGGVTIIVGVGPASYCEQRYWFPPELRSAITDARRWLRDSRPLAAVGYPRYVEWWCDLGFRHHIEVQVERWRREVAEQAERSPLPRPYPQPTPEQLAEAGERINRKHWTPTKTSP